MDIYIYIYIYSDFWVGRKRQTICFAELNQKYRYRDGQCLVSRRAETA